MIVTVNGTGKAKDSNSEYFLGLLRDRLGEETFRSYLAGKEEEWAAIAGEILKSDCLILTMPLYVDGVPAQMLAFMEYMADYVKENRPAQAIACYVIANCGFYEGCQNRHLFNIVRCWCQRTGFTWKMGLGIGSGELFGSMRSIALGKGPTGHLAAGIQSLAAAVAKRAEAEDVYVQPNGISQRMFLLCCNGFWSGNAKRNGLHRKEISRKMV